MNLKVDLSNLTWLNRYAYKKCLTSIENYVLWCKFYCWYTLHKFILKEMSMVFSFGHPPKCRPPQWCLTLMIGLTVLCCSGNRITERRILAFILKMIPAKCHHVTIIFFLHDEMTSEIFLEGISNLVLNVYDFNTISAFH